MGSGARFMRFTALERCRLAEASSLGLHSRILVRP
jgi:hypothetical protein